MPYRAVAAALAFTLLAGPLPAAAQTKASNIIPEATAHMVEAKILAIDAGTRQVTLQEPSGAKTTVTAGPAIRLEMLKAGDTVHARYYRAVAFVVSPPSAPVPDNEIAAVAARPVEAPGGAVAKVTRISATVVAIDPGANTVDVVKPGGGEVVSVTVTDPERQKLLPHIKVGDTITAVVSETLAVAIEPAPAKK